MKQGRQVDTYYIKLHKKTPWIFGAVFDILESFMGAVVVVFLLFTLAFRAVGVSGDSMNPTLVDGDWVAVTGIVSNIQKGDVVVVTQPWERDIPIIKRVIAVGGDTVNIDFVTGDVFINGEIIDEDYIKERTYINYNAVFPMTVPEGKVFVMGDNRNDSLDSRSEKVGLIDENYILGKAVFRFYPAPKSLRRAVE